LRLHAREILDLIVRVAGRRVVQFVYLRGGPKKPSHVTTHGQSYEKAGHCCFQTAIVERRTAAGAEFILKLRMWAVKLAGSDNGWREPPG